MYAGSSTDRYDLYFPVFDASVSYHKMALELLCQWYTIIQRSDVPFLRLLKSAWGQWSYPSVPDEEHEDITQNNSDIASWMWAPGLLVAIAATILSMKLAFGISLLKIVLALGLSFVLSIVAIQATGATGESLWFPLFYPDMLPTNLRPSNSDTTPLTAVATISQIVLGATHSADSGNLALRQRLNLLGGALANIGANQACGILTLLFHTYNHELILLSQT